MNVKVSAWLFPIVLTMSTIMQMEDVNVGIQKLLKSVIWSEVLKNQVLVLIVSRDYKNFYYFDQTLNKKFGMFEVWFFDVHSHSHSQNFPVHFVQWEFRQRGQIFQSI